jgi:hypothetical protein
MWSGFDPEIWRQLERIREMVALRHQTPTREWPLTLAERDDDLLVIREWPNGSLTAYAISRVSGDNTGSE